jgi:3-hydroxyacyl-CoA dehydrogenase/enoyl-CoA hydratase/3-hydroxybutyryl-CoA epimerase
VTGRHVRLEVRPDGVALVVLDDPEARHVTLTPELGEELLAAVEEILRDPHVTAAVLASAKEESFLVGANVAALRALRFAGEATAMAKRLAAGFARIARSPKPFVACVHGPALGTGFELALACAAIVASDDPRTAVGLPEVKLGLLPAGNGLLRVAERAGVRTAMTLGLSGRALPSGRARALGLVDEVVAPSVAREAACALARRLAAGPRGSRRAPLTPSAVERWFTERNPVGRALLFRRARAETLARTLGHYPAPERMLDVLERFAARGEGAAAELEATHVGELVVSESSHRLVELFLAIAAAKKDAGQEASDGVEAASAAHVQRMAVVGAGLIGAGIAAVSAERGVIVRLEDKDEGALGRGLRYVNGYLEGRAHKGALVPLEVRAALARLSSTTTLTGLRTADLVVEAVFEELSLKHEVLRALEEHVREDCVIASSTAALTVARIAEALRHPERVLGMHYFAPVPKVLLVEVVRGPQTSARALATAVELGRRQGKTVIVVRDGVGFYTTRTLSPFLHEALRLVEEGVPVDVVDEALVAWGFPIGPLHLMDELGIDLVAHVAITVGTAFGDRLRPPQALASLRMDDRKGRKNGRGFYLYGRGARAEKRVDDTLYAAIGVAPRRASADLPKREEIQTRCALALVAEAVRSLDEGVLRSARDGDLGAVLGLGFPAFRGGPFRYVDVLGASEVLGRMRALEQQHGDRFTPPTALVEAARRSKRFCGP